MKDARGFEGGRVEKKLMEVPLLGSGPILMTSAHPVRHAERGQVAHVVQRVHFPEFPGRAIRPTIRVPCPRLIHLAQSSPGEATREGSRGRGGGIVRPDRADTHTEDVSAGQHERQTLLIKLHHGCHHWYAHRESYPKERARV